MKNLNRQQRAVLIAGLIFSGLSILLSGIDEWNHHLLIVAPFILLYAVAVVPSLKNPERFPIIPTVLLLTFVIPMVVYAIRYSTAGVFGLAAINFIYSIWIYPVKFIEESTPPNTGDAQPPNPAISPEEAN